MRTPRIITGTAPAVLERLASQRRIRYGLAPAAVAIPCAAAVYLGQNIGRDFYLTILFCAMLVASVLGGFGPGFLATGLAMAVGYFVPRGLLDLADMRLLAVEGVMVSIVGGALITARRKARERLESNLRLEQRILEIGDDERRRTGHDLHDGLGQHLTGISLLSETMAQQLAAGKTPDRATIETITRLVSEAVKITRDLARSLSPVTLEQDGFVAAIEELAGTSSSLLGINCRGDFDNQELRLDRTRAMHLYRIAQEAVNNSVRHGKARNVEIEVRQSGNELTVRVRDDGSGLSAKTMSDPGLGLRIMQYRAKMLAATLEVERATQSGGTIVTCRCPIDGQPEEDGSKA